MKFSTLVSSALGIVSVANATNCAIKPYNACPTTVFDMTKPQPKFGVEVSQEGESTFKYKLSFSIDSGLQKDSLQLLQLVGTGQTVTLFDEASRVDEISDANFWQYEITGPADISGDLYCVPPISVVYLWHCGKNKRGYKEGGYNATACVNAAYPIS
ncbi:uncharacterized protein KQ657_003069, partial [Scheffersomyces spartinae]